jgi:hypothetical protein
MQDKSKKSNKKSEVPSRQLETGWAETWGAGHTHSRWKKYGTSENRKVIYTIWLTGPAPNP